MAYVQKFKIIISKSVCCILAIILVGSVDTGGRCETTSSYNCGVAFPPNGNTCSGKRCCCKGDNGKCFTHRGCKSCRGTYACRSTENMNIVSSSCHGTDACRYTSDSNILNDSCQGKKESCKHLINMKIGSNSCNGKYACFRASDSSILDDSCRGEKCMC